MCFLFAFTKCLSLEFKKQYLTVVSFSFCNFYSHLFPDPPASLQLVTRENTCLFPLFINICKHICLPEESLRIENELVIDFLKFKFSKPFPANAPLK